MRPTRIPISPSLRGVLDYIQSELKRLRMEPGGAICPCCGQLVKAYWRSMNSTMARFLIKLVRIYEKTGTWVNVRKRADFAKLRGGDYAYLKHWGFIEAMDNDDDSKRSSGLWKPTEAGIAFAKKESLANKSVLLYNNKIVEWSREHVNIEGALGRRFNYTALMYGEER